MISVIIPVLNEEKHLEECLKIFSMQKCELIVVDGGSVDRSLEIARENGVTTIALGFANKGRQMNEGAAHSSGDILLFFHADSILPGGALKMIEDVLENKYLLGGTFKLGFHPSKPFYSFLAFFTNIFCSLTRMAFGDRGIFMKRQVFLSLGGFKEYAIMEDADMSDMLRKKGKTAMLPLRVSTSARKYANETHIQACYRTIYACIAYWAGVDPEKIKEGYYKSAKE